MTVRYAAIDFGTNTARLLIAERVAGRLNVLHCQREIVRLGGGFTREHGLSAAAQQRGLSCLVRFAAEIGRFEVSKVRASATSAVRDAVNGREFVETVLEQTGITLNVISGELEGKLTLKGVISGLDTAHEELVVLDVGGGSTEFTISHNNVPVFVKSMPMGVVRLTEGFATIDAITARIRFILDDLMAELASAAVTVRPGSVLIATAGTATTLAAMQMEMNEYDYRLVNNYVMQRSAIDVLYGRLMPLTPAERLSIPGLEAGREDLIIAGMLILIGVMERFGFNAMKVSDFGLLEGLALSDEELTQG
ncbi:MAG: exopolyphosphatase [Desulfuromonadales bacterium]